MEQGVTLTLSSSLKANTKSFPGMETRVVQIVPAVRMGGILHHLKSLESIPERYKVCSVSLFDADENEALNALQMPVFRFRLPLEDCGKTHMVCSRLEPFLRDLQPHLLHSHHTFSDVVVAEAGHTLGLKTVRTIHGMSQRDIDRPLEIRDARLGWSATERNRQCAVDS